MAEARNVAGRRYALAIMAFLDEDESTTDAWTEAVDVRGDNQPKPVRASSDSAV